MRISSFTLCLLLITSSGCTALGPRSVVSHSSGNGPETKLLRQVNDDVRADACKTTGIELARKGQTEHAVHQLEQARHYAPQMKGVAHPLAVLYDQQGLYSKAELEYRKALKEAPRDASLLSDYGYFLYERGELKEAEAHLRQAIKRSPSHQKASVNLGMVLAEQQRYEEALITFKDVVGEAAAHHNLAVIRYRHGGASEARKHFETAAKLDPGLQPPRMLLSYLDDRENTSVQHVNHEVDEVPSR